MKNAGTPSRGTYHTRSVCTLEYFTGFIRFTLPIVLMHLILCCRHPKRVPAGPTSDTTNGCMQICAQTPTASKVQEDTSMI